MDLFRYKDANDLLDGIYFVHRTKSEEGLVCIRFER